MIVELLLLGIVSSVSSQSFHHNISPEDLEHVFSVKNVAEVPDYDIVPISIRKPRSPGMENSFLFEQPFGERIKMWLSPSNGALFSKDLSVSFIESNPSNKSEVTITTYTNVLAHFRPSFYENYFYATTLAVNPHTNGKYSVKGFIGNKYIKPVPSHLMNRARRHRRSVNKALDHESDEIYHVVYDIPQTQKEMLSLPTIYPPKSSASNWTIYPEVFVIVQYGIVNVIKSYRDKVLYVLAFWNGVDMRYRSFVNPKIRLNIAHILFAKDKEALPNATSFSDGRYIYNHDTALRTMGDWLYLQSNTFPIDSYDLAVVMTPFHLCKEEYNGKGDQVCYTTGVAWKNGACTIYHDIMSMNKVAFVRDLGRFNGIKTAAHELGHLFGVANHDSRTENETCEHSDGYIMTPWEDFAQHSFEWSQCSINQMGWFLRSDDAACLGNKPSHNVKDFPRYLPGKLYTADQQCQAFEKASLDTTVKFNCHSMTCSRDENPSLTFIIEPAEGTSCGDRKLCLHGQCLDEDSIE